ncbi:hypothetical protein PPERSA_05542 [Pseudocohnilembus persalinus]|uniref:Uncharacterized protein n=1 Tax=Pseudocohnilembus persalinus TaxID=266149 RepID=A0A0V0QSV0_PSEPJ|nr:hypothetical protein PPERSA_05542 [Pseudocohnilembus persalinus]|eukprot:KRX05433.1 hypothetical protein PPERSA_05542 [Pseudocohnilembus persalinus]
MTKITASYVGNSNKFNKNTNNKKKKETQSIKKLENQKKVESQKKESSQKKTSDKKESNEKKEPNKQKEKNQKKDENQKSEANKNENENQDISNQIEKMQDGTPQKQEEQNDNQQQNQEQKITCQSKKKEIKKSFIVSEQFLNQIKNFYFQHNDMFKISIKFLENFYEYKDINYFTGYLFEKLIEIEEFKQNFEFQGHSEDIQREQIE